MSWQEGVAVTVMLFGLDAAAFLVAQRPSFWIEFGSRLRRALSRLSRLYVMKRMPRRVRLRWGGREMSGLRSDAVEE